MSIFNKLNLIISNYIGYDEDDECADPEAHDLITNECNEYIHHNKPMGKHAQYCYNEWKEYMMSSKPFNNDERYAEY